MDQIRHRRPSSRRFGALGAGGLLLLALSGGCGGDSSTKSPTSVVISGPGGIQHGTCCSFQAAIYSDGKQPFTSGNDSTLNKLSGTLAGAIFSDSACATALSSVVVKAGSSSTTFYVNEPKTATYGSTNEDLIVGGLHYLIAETFSLSVY